MLTGQIMSEGGLALRLVNLAHLFAGRIRGGLAMVNSVACMFFGNISWLTATESAAI
ncbi:TRAP transporter large permease subunit [Brevibacillus thermoruber]|uniref:TRAP transporter large permease subunit n=1 Tax=Brevibacillus thermoruber TaxID=33942 RepID=UPI0040434E83